MHGQLEQRKPLLPPVLRRKNRQASSSYHFPFGLERLGTIRLVKILEMKGA
jgi:hypothetical protein